MPETLTRRRRRASTPTAESFGVAITNPDRVIFPDDGLTKHDLADYYAGDRALDLVDAAERPMTLIRCPQGRGQEMLLPEARHRLDGRPSTTCRSRRRTARLRTISTSTTSRLLACVQMGTIEFHGWGSKVAKVENPDRLVFDLDPDVGLDFAKVKEAAVRLRGLLEDLGLKSFPLLSGGKGIHVVVPLDASKDWPAVKSFAERFSRAIAEAEPEMFTANIRKAQRKGRIFLDWLRNQRGATAVMPYSARAREGAPVAAPVAWEELDAFDGGNHFTHPRCRRAARPREFEERLPAGARRSKHCRMRKLLLPSRSSLPPHRRFAARARPLARRSGERHHYPRRLGHCPRPWAKTTPTPCSE